MDGQCLHRLSGIQASSRRARRIQRQVHVESDDSAGRVVRHAGESCARDLSQFLSACDTMAVQRPSSGSLTRSRTPHAMLPNTLTSRLAVSDTRDALLSEVRRGLVRRPRSLSPWMFYDANGSRLFECITRVPEYYLTRTERHILTCFADVIIALTPSDPSQPVRLVELGAGTAAKTDILLKAVLRTPRPVLYLPVDVSPRALAIARGRITSWSADIRVEPAVANYVTDPPWLRPFDGATLALYLGSSIGKF